MIKRIVEKAVFKWLNKNFKQKDLKDAVKYWAGSKQDLVGWYVNIAVEAHVKRTHIIKSIVEQINELQLEKK